MHIEEKKVFIFEFPYEQTTLTIPVKAESKQEAAEKLQKFLSLIQTDLAMEFPKVMFKMDTDRRPPPSPEELKTPISIPPEVLELRMDTLLGDMGGSQLKGKAKDETIKLWTGYENVEGNYFLIIQELELLKSGQKEIPKKNK